MSSPSGGLVLPVGDSRPPERCGQLAGRVVLGILSLAGINGCRRRLLGRGRLSGLGRARLRRFRLGSRGVRLGRRIAR